MRIQYNSFSDAHATLVDRLVSSANRLSAASTDRYGGHERDCVADVRMARKDENFVEDTGYTQLVSAVEHVFTQTSFDTQDGTVNSDMRDMLGIIAAYHTETFLTIWDEARPPTPHADAWAGRVIGEAFVNAYGTAVQTARQQTNEDLVVTYRNPFVEHDGEHRPGYKPQQSYTIEEEHDVLTFLGAAGDFVGGLWSELTIETYLDEMMEQELISDTIAEQFPQQDFMFSGREIETELQDLAAYLDNMNTFDLGLYEADAETSDILPAISATPELPHSFRDVYRRQEDELTSRLP